MMSDLSDLFLYKDRTRGPIVDGIFYSDDDKQLMEEVKELLAEVKDPPGSCFGIIAPHAAYPYSGSLTASAFKSVADRKPDNIVIISHVNREYKDSAFLTESESFSIPTGSIIVNNEINIRLLDYNPLFVKDDMPHLEEHSIEIQLPFIKYLFPEAKIVPILIGSNNPILIKTVANGLKTVFRGSYEKTLFIVSANFTNYLPPSEANNYFNLISEMILKNDLKKITEEIISNSGKTNGLGSMAVILELAGENAVLKMLKKRNSTDTLDDNEKIVCYGAVSVISDIK